MKDLLATLAESAHNLDRNGLFKEADLLDNIIRKLAEAPLPAVTARVLVDRAKQLLLPLNASDVGASVALKRAKEMLGQLDAAVSAVFQEKKSGEPVRALAKEVLKGFLALSNSQNRVANEMFQPAVKPMVDILQALIRMPDHLVFGG